MDDEQRQRELMKKRNRLQFKMAYMMLKTIGGDAEVPQPVKDAYKKETTEPNKKGTLKACLIDGTTMCDLMEIKYFLEQILMDGLDYIKDHPEATKEVNPMDMLAELLGGE